MLGIRLLAAVSVALTVAAACSSGGSSSSAKGTGGHGSTGTGGASTGSHATGAGGAITTSTTVGSGGAGGEGPGDAGSNDAELLDAADESLGKGGLKAGVPCGSSAAAADAGLCGLGLSCCYPCKEQMCDSVCTLSCNPHTSGCMGGCIPQL